jgi:hypothetical protein
MSNETLLAALLAQAHEEGAPMATLRGLIEEASQLGARRAFADLGLADDLAGRDVRELRDLLRAWRDVKSSAVKAVAGWAVRLLLAVLLVGLTVRAGLVEHLR